MRWPLISIVSPSITVAFPLIDFARAPEPKLNRIETIAMQNIAMQNRELLLRKIIK